MLPIELSKDLIQKILPHRDNMLLIDTAMILTTHNIISNAIFDANSIFVKGHFPDYPILPGVITMETMAQTCCILSVYQKTHNDAAKKNTNIKDVFPTSLTNLSIMPRLVMIQNAKFIKAITPPIVLKTEAKYIRHIGNMHFFECHSWVDKTEVSSATIVATIV